MKKVMKTCLLADVLCFAACMAVFSFSESAAVRVVMHVVMAANIADVALMILVKKKIMRVEQAFRNVLTDMPVTEDELEELDGENGGE